MEGLVRIFFAAFFCGMAAILLAIAWGEVTVKGDLLLGVASIVVATPFLLLSIGNLVNLQRHPVLAKIVDVFDRSGTSSPLDLVKAMIFTMMFMILVEGPIYGLEIRTVLLLIGFGLATIAFTIHVYPWQSNRR